MKGASPRRSRPRKAAPADAALRLREQSRRVTAPRQAILRALHERRQPLSCKELFQRLSKGDCDLATIYRSLHLLENLGLVKRYDFGDGVARYELVGAGDDGHHHHLVCVRCARVVEIEECFLLEMEEKIAKRNGFKSVTHKLEFFGVCPRCRA